MKSWTKITKEIQQKLDDEKEIRLIIAKELQATKDRHGDFCIDLAAANTDKNKLHEQVSILHNQVSSNKGEIEELKTNNKDATETIKVLNNDLARGKQDKDSLLKEMESAKLQLNKIKKAGLFRRIFRRYK